MVLWQWEPNQYLIQTSWEERYSVLHIGCLRTSVEHTHAVQAWRIAEDLLLGRQLHPCNPPWGIAGMAPFPSLACSDRRVERSVDL